MDEIDDGGPAFAAGSSQGDWQSGMSLRDWFAGQALAGLLSRTTDISVGELGKLSDVGASKASFFFADAMLEARKA